MRYFIIPLGVLALISVVFPINSHAMRAITVGGHVACTAKADLEDIITFVISKDYDSADVYIKQNRCWVLKGGIVVTVLDAGWSKCECVFKGIKFWTIREALTFGD